MADFADESSLTTGPSSSSRHLELLVADADGATGELCRKVATNLGYAMLTAKTAATVLSVLEGKLVDALLLDSDLPGSDGYQLLKHLRYWYPETQVIFVARYASLSAAVLVTKLGAFDYLAKPLELQTLKLTIVRAMEERQLDTGGESAIREELWAERGFGNLIGQSREMAKLYRVIRKISVSNHPVLILGESGTGKELVARAIHFNGPRRERPFIPVDCGALVATLMESELFGYEKGAFTGAERSKEGLLTIAERGTVFFDEIGEMPIELQAKLLRALQEKEIRPVGSTRRIPINIRVVAATNRDLESAVQQGSFRKDLYYRLNVVTLKIPPLRDRKRDIEPLVEAFLDRISQANARRLEITPEAMNVLKAYDWPGNVRELENCLERAAALSSGSVLHVPDLPTQVLSGANRQVNAGNREPEAQDTAVFAMAHIERQAILNAIARAKGDKLVAARLLGIGKTTLYRRLKKYEEEKE
jgi:Response regulator containing CheY-like receiver, AAA-type ATPase, and DNA-binding domains